MPGEPTAKVLASLPPILWALLGAYVVWLLRGALPTAVRGLTGPEAFGVKLAISGQAMSAAIDLARKHPDWDSQVNEADRKRALDRAAKQRDLLEGAEILWVDDRPSNNRNEARMLRGFGAMVTFACTTPEAMRALATAAEQGQPFHVILSDISRDIPDANPAAGLAMLPLLRAEHHFEPVVFYVGRSDPNAGTPPGAFGLANRPDQLLHLTLDALARVRGAK